MGKKKAAESAPVPTQFRPRKERRTHGAARWSDRGAVANECGRRQRDARSGRQRRTRARQTAVGCPILPIQHALRNPWLDLAHELRDVFGAGLDGAIRPSLFDARLGRGILVHKGMPHVIRPTLLVVVVLIDRLDSFGQLEAPMANREEPTFSQLQQRVAHEVTALAYRHPERERRRDHVGIDCRWPPYQRDKVTDLIFAPTTFGANELDIHVVRGRATTTWAYKGTSKQPRSTHGAIIRASDGLRVSFTTCTSRRRVTRFGLNTSRSEFRLHPCADTIQGWSERFKREAARGVEGGAGLPRGVTRPISASLPLRLDGWGTRSDASMSGASCCADIQTSPTTCHLPSASAVYIALVQRSRLAQFDRTILPVDPNNAKFSRFTSRCRLPVRKHAHRVHRRG